MLAESCGRFQNFCDVKSFKFNRGHFSPRKPVTVPCEWQQQQAALRNRMTAKTIPKPALGLGKRPLFRSERENDQSLNLFRAVRELLNHVIPRNDLLDLLCEYGKAQDVASFCQAQHR